MGLAVFVQTRVERVATRAGQIRSGRVFRLRQSELPVGGKSIPIGREALIRSPRRICPAGCSTLDCLRPLSRVFPFFCDFDMAWHGASLRRQF